MTKKIIALAGVGEVTFHKRKASRSIKLRLDVHGTPVVTLPYFMPFKLAEQFVLKHSDWLIEEQSKRSIIITEGMRIGRVHVVRFVRDGTVTKPVVRVNASQIIVRYGEEAPIAATVQSAAKSGAIKALKREATHFLPKRLKDVADAHGYEFESVSVKQLKGRWGSCDSKKNIILNCFLMQLPVEYIDYVILHELAHTRALHHGPEFWSEFDRHLPGAKAWRTRMKRFQPTIMASQATSMS
jgi:predicted metal-dependent hydrolase